MPSAVVELIGNHNRRSSKQWVERIGDFQLAAQTPGIVRSRRTTALHTAHPVMPLIDRIDFAGAHRAADVATAHIGQAAYLVSLEVGLPNDPRRAFPMVARRKSALGDKTTDMDWLTARAAAASSSVASPRSARSPSR